RNVGEWFVRYVREVPGIGTQMVAATDNVLAAVREPGVAGVILSGSPRDAWAVDPVNDRLAEMIRECERRRIPFLGVCYGHQLLGRVLGAEVGREPAGLELGNAVVTLTEAGQRSALFAGLPKELEVLQSHQDAVLTLPAGAELLAEGNHTRVQAMRFGEWLWGVQFHPEQDPDILRFIWEPRRETWRDRCRFDLDQRLAELRPTPVAPQVLRNFANMCRRTAR
ncbi:MAG: gamma-glutamyl-gamma-aminobutyrate hydrolase family protein, partial [Verrucomicrobiae bacterium]|nr:gamma-glutamyl-gamma-aminobutyrate hydrolase family protein [Verrucomicrobiae bacterium]